MIFVQFYRYEKADDPLDSKHTEVEGRYGRASLDPLVSFTLARQTARKLCKLRGYDAFALCRRHVKTDTVTRVSPIMPV